MEDEEHPFLHDFFFEVNRMLEKQSDFDFLVDADLELRDESGDNLGLSRFKLCDLEPESVKFATLLLEKFELKENAVVHVMLPNCTGFYPPVFGIWLAGGIVSSGDFAVTASNMVNMIRDCDAKIVVCAISNLEQVCHALGHLEDVKAIVLGQNEQEIPTSISDRVFFYQSLKPSLPSIPSISSLPTSSWQKSDSELAVIFWSSGTTGRSKGIKHGFILMRQLLRERAWRPPVPKVLITTCFHHTGGFLYPLLNLLTSATTYFLAPEALDKDGSGKDSIWKIFGATDKFRTNLLMAGTHHLIRAANYEFDDTDSGFELDSMLVAAGFGSAYPKSTAERLRSKCPSLRIVANNFGCSEAGSFVTENSRDDSMGQVARNREVKVVDPDTWQRLGPMQPGLMLVKTPYLMLGYLNSDEKAFDEEGWLITGDIVYYDESGFYYHVNRAKDLIKVENNHLFPMEVESLLNSHPNVAESAVFGRPDELLMERITALVVLRPGAVACEDELLKMVSHQLEPYKAIRGGIKFVQSIPKNSMGKILRKDLPRLFKA